MGRTEQNSPGFEGISLTLPGWRKEKNNLKKR